MKRGFSFWEGPPATPRSSTIVGSACPQRLLGRDRPDEPGELAGARDDDLLVRLAAAGHPLPASVQTLLAAPCALDDERVLAPLAARELVADVGRRRPFQAASISSRRAWLMPALVIEPCRRLSPVERSLGTRPTKLMNCSAVLNRVKSPASATSPIAVSVSIPRMHRSLAISSRMRALVRRAGQIARSSTLDAPVDLVDCEQIVVERLLLAGQLERLASQPRATRQAPAGRRHPPVMAQTGTSPGGGGRASGPAARPPGPAPDPAAPRAPASGRRSPVNSPAACNPASRRASRLSVFTRSPGRDGTSPGATTHTVDPRGQQSPVQPEPRRSRLMADPRARPRAAAAAPQPRGRCPASSRPAAHPPLTAASRTDSLCTSSPTVDSPAILHHGRRPPYVARPGHARQPTQMRRSPTTFTERPDYPAAPSCLANRAAGSSGPAPRGTRPRAA